MKEQIIHLESHDDVVSVRDKLGWIRTSRVLLVLPDDPRERILQRKLDLVFIQREATRRRAQLALITRDLIVIEHAHELGIATFPNIKASRRRYWRTDRARLTVQRADQPHPLVPELAEAGTRLHPIPDARTPRLSRIAATLLFVLTLLSLTGGAYVVLPGATIHLSPAANQVTVTTVITADSEASVIDPEHSVIPARRVGIEVEWSTAIDTTGFKEEPSEKARGTVIFTNLIPDQITIVAGTVVRTTAGQPVRYVTLTDATLPGQVGETVETSIEAILPGFEGNVPSNYINQIEGPLAARVAVSNPEPTWGGDVRQIPAVSRDDYERLRATLLQQLQQRAFAEMQTDPYIALQDTEFIPIESLVVVLIHDETYDRYVGEAAERVGLEMRVTVQGVAIDARNARRLVYAHLADKVGPGYRIDADSLIFRQGDIIQVDDDQRVAFIMQGAGDVSATIQPSRVQQMVRGKPVREAEFILSRELPLASQPEITMWPQFWPQMPFLALRISVVETGN